MDQPRSAVVVLGKRLLAGDAMAGELVARMDRALELYRALEIRCESGALLVLSGGGREGSATEARQMANYAIARGVNRDRILLDEHATTTDENFTNVSSLLDNLGFCGHVFVVTSGYHVWRANQATRRVGLDAVMIAARTPAGEAPAAVVREIGAIICENRRVLIAAMGAVAAALLWRRR